MFESDSIHMKRFQIAEQIIFSSPANPFVWNRNVQITVNLGIQGYA